MQSKRGLNGGTQDDTDMPEWISADKESLFPNLDRSVYEKTSDEDQFNNCVAWAAGDDSRWWQPPFEPWHYWPTGAPLNSDVPSFVTAYELEGFERCDDASQEPGYEKLAIYGYPNGEFSHAARLNEDGSWSSKLGDWEDIRHNSLTNLEGPYPAYGTVVVFMRRRL